MCLPDGDNLSSQPSNGHASHAHSHSPDAQSATGQTSTGTGRRTFLRTAGLAGVGAAALGAITAGPALAATAPANAAQNAGGGWNPDQDSPRFTLAVMPDTQFLYWGTQGSINPEPQEESFRYILANNGKGSANNIVFMAHLGDMT